MTQQRTASPDITGDLSVTKGGAKEESSTRHAYILGQRKGNGHYHAIEVFAFDGGNMINGISPTLQGEAVVKPLTQEPLPTVSDQIIPRTIEQGNAWVRRAERVDSAVTLDDYALIIAYAYDARRDEMAPMDPAAFLAGVPTPLF